VPHPQEILLAIVKQVIDMAEPDHLIEKLKQGDQDAFRWLVTTFQSRVINLCYGYLHDLHEAEDIAQDVFVEVLDSISHFRGDASISTWLYRVAVNKSLNRRKRNNLKKLLFIGIGNKESDNNPSQYQIADTSWGSSPDHSLRHSEDKRVLQQAIDRLPQNQKTAFLLSKYEQLPYKEIAAVMNTSVPAVESLLFRARSNLQKSLRHYMEKK